MTAFEKAEIRTRLRFHVGRLLAAPFYAVYDVGTLFCRVGDRLADWSERV